MHTNRQALPQERQAGVCLHITSLPGRYGIGEIGAAACRFIDLMSDMNLRVWQFLPTGPTGFGDSPYQPLSTFAGNELLLDIAALVRTGLLKSQETDALLGLPSDAVAYGELIPKKTALLRLAASRFHGLADSDHKAGFDRFVDAHDRRWLHDYALFRILKSQHGDRPWTAWEAPFRYRDATAIRSLEVASGRQIEHLKIIQFLFHHQWQQLREFAHDRGVLLFGDMPMFIAMDSADAWANRDILCLDRDGDAEFVAGVPPDYFSDQGQLWGNPLYAWDEQAADGYRWWIDRLRHAMGLADLLRIDHFRGFDSYWAVPAEAKTARIGEWRPGPGSAVFDAMRNALGGLPIVAEDLGMITPEVEALRDRLHLPGMKVLQFEMSHAGFDITTIAEHCVCYTGTHDNDTTIGWFNGSPNDKRGRKEILKLQKTVLEISNGLPETIHADLTRLAFSSPARLAIVPLQDYLGLGPQARLNTPGTSAGNWRWRVQSPQLRLAPLEWIGEMVQASDRGIAR
jgi:4-alpha-glucanotransferase